MTRSGGENGPEYSYPGLDALGGATHTIEDFYSHAARLGVADPSGRLS